VLEDQLKPHDPAYYSTVQVKANYDPEAKCPRWMEFLHSVLDEPEVNLLQEIFGYFLVPMTRAQKSFILCGLPGEIAQAVHRLRPAAQAGQESHSKSQGQTAEFPSAQLGFC